MVVEHRRQRHRWGGSHDHPGVLIADGSCGVGSKVKGRTPCAPREAGRALPDAFCASARDFGHDFRRGSG
jgi:hypothetical protein